VGATFHPVTHRRSEAVLNVTVVDAQSPGYATVFPCDQPRPDASNLNYADG
jgi:hypothetical protein